MPARILPNWHNPTNLTYEEYCRFRAEIQANMEMHNSIKKEKTGGVNSVRTE